MLGSVRSLRADSGGVGAYGVVSYLVTQSQHGYRPAGLLGAQRTDILRMVMWEGAGLAGWGIGLGLLGALSLTRVMASLLFGVGARDAVTFSAVAAALGLIAMLATYVPLRRATTVDPMVALREE
jgi:putative ABC transport system permease protein